MYKKNFFASISVEGSQSVGRWHINGRSLSHFADSWRFCSAIAGKANWLLRHNNMQRAVTLFTSVFRFPFPGSGLSQRGLGAHAPNYAQ